MSSILVESTLSKIIPRLFSFSYALLCHREDAEKMVFDTVFLLRKDPLILRLFKEYEVEDNKENRIEYPVKIKLEVFRILYRMVDKKLSKRPYAEGIFKENIVNFSSFFSLEYRDRAILFLKYHEHLDHNDMSRIFCKEATEMISGLVIAKNHLSEVISL